jgi:type IX secretion system PorP/SprF family membrane protein
MSKKLIFNITGLMLLCAFSQLKAQENYFSQYYMVGPAMNPSLAGDSRFGQLQLSERLQATTSGTTLTNTLLSYDQKIPNQRSGIHFSFQQKTADYSEQKLRLNYSYTLFLFDKYWIKTGLGISGNILNTSANSYQYPDQYNDYGYTGQASQEVFSDEKELYPGLSTGFTLYNDFALISVAVDNLNRPRIGILEEDYRAPLILQASWSMLIPINKNQRSRRLISPKGGLVPYSSLGPWVDYRREGDFHVLQFGLHAYTHPFFWGIGYRYNALSSYYLDEGVASLNLSLGYRTEWFTVSYSYDYSLTSTPANYKGAHEITLGYCFYSLKNDYQKNKPVPFPNQLMY